jgi:uroporphyrinogen-III synthase
MSALILITRPEDDASKLATLLEARGYATMSEPMLHLGPLEAGITALEGINYRAYQGIIATSRHAFPALEPLHKLHTLPAYVVGDATAREAARCGFPEIFSAPTAQSLLALITLYATPRERPLLYVRGQEVSHDFSVLLRPEGFSVESLPVYRMRQPASFSDTLRAALAERRITHATFLSARSAQAFVANAGGAALDGITAIAMSKAVADVLRSLRWQRIAVAAEPNLDAVIAEVDKLASGG